MSENDTTIEDMIAKQRIINEMVANCGTAYPDRTNSPGGEWLFGLHEAMEAAWAEGRFDPESDRDDSDVVTEIADAHVPVATHERWEVFTDLAAYTHEVIEDREIEMDYRDTFTWVGAVLFYIADQGAGAWIQEKREQQTDPSCGHCDECAEFEACGECPECTPDED